MDEKTMQPLNAAVPMVFYPMGYPPPSRFSSTPSPPVPQPAILPTMSSQILTPTAPPSFYSSVPPPQFVPSSTVSHAVAPPGGISQPMTTYTRNTLRASNPPQSNLLPGRIFRHALRPTSPKAQQLNVESAPGAYPRKNGTCGPSENWDMTTQHESAATDSYNKDTDRLHRVFGQVIYDHGPLDTMDARIFGAFINLSVSDRQIIKEQGGIMPFLKKADYIHVDEKGLKLSVTAIPPEKHTQDDDDSKSYYNNDYMPSYMGGYADTAAAYLDEYQPHYDEGEDDKDIGSEEVNSDSREDLERSLFKTMASSHGITIDKQIERKDPSTANPISQSLDTVASQDKEENAEENAFEEIAYSHGIVIEKPGEKKDERTVLTPSESNQHQVLHSSGEYQSEVGLFPEPREDLVVSSALMQNWSVPGTEDEVYFSGDEEEDQTPRGLDIDDQSREESVYDRRASVGRDDEKKRSSRCSNMPASNNGEQKTEQRPRSTHAVVKTSTEEEKFDTNFGVDVTLERSSANSHITEKIKDLSLQEGRNCGDEDEVEAHCLVSGIVEDMVTISSLTGEAKHDMSSGSLLNISSAEFVPRLSHGAAAAQSAVMTDPQTFVRRLSVEVPEFKPRPVNHWSTWGHQVSSPSPTESAVSPPFVRSKNMVTQTEVVEKTEVATNTKKVKKCVFGMQTLKSEVAEVAINTMETFTCEESDYLIQATVAHEDAFTQTPDRSQSLCEKATCTVREEFPPFSLDETKHKRLQDRAISAEDQVLRLQGEMCVLSLQRTRMDMELQIRLGYAQSEKSLYDAMKNIESEISRIKILVAENRRALTRGAELAGLPQVSATGLLLFGKVSQTSETNESSSNSLTTSSNNDLQKEDMTFKMTSLSIEPKQTSGITTSSRTKSDSESSSLFASSLETKQPSPVKRSSRVKTDSESSSLLEVKQPSAVKKPSRYDSDSESSSLDPPQLFPLKRSMRLKTDSESSSVIESTLDLRAMVTPDLTFTEPGDDTSRMQSSSHSTSLPAPDDVSTVMMAGDPLKNHTGPISESSDSDKGQILVKSESSDSVQGQTLVRSESKNSVKDQPILISEISDSNQNQTCAKSRSYDDTREVTRVASESSDGALTKPPPGLQNLQDVGLAAQDTNATKQRKVKTVTRSPVNEYHATIMSPESLALSEKDLLQKRQLYEETTQLALSGDGVLKDRCESEDSEGTEDEREIAELDTYNPDEDTSDSETGSASPPNSPERTTDVAEDLADHQESHTSINQEMAEGNEAVQSEHSSLTSQQGAEGKDTKQNVAASKPLQTQTDATSGSKVDDVSSPTGQLTNMAARPGLQPPAPPSGVNQQQPSFDPVLHQAVMMQLVQVYPHLVSSPQMLNVLAMQHMIAIQKHQAAQQEQQQQLATTQHIQQQASVALTMQQQLAIGQQQQQQQASVAPRMQQQQQKENGNVQQVQHHVGASGDTNTPATAHPRVGTAASRAETGAVIVDPGSHLQKTRKRERQISEQSRASSTSVSSYEAFSRQLSEEAVDRESVSSSENNAKGIAIPVGNRYNRSTVDRVSSVESQSGSLGSWKNNNPISKMAASSSSSDRNSSVRTPSPSVASSEILTGNLNRSHGDSFLPSRMKPVGFLPPAPVSNAPTPSSGGDWDEEVDDFAQPWVQSQFRTMAVNAGAKEDNKKAAIVGQGKKVRLPKLPAKTAVSSSSVSSSSTSSQNSQSEVVPSKVRKQDSSHTVIEKHSQSKEFYNKPLKSTFKDPNEDFFNNTYSYSCAGTDSQNGNAASNLPPRLAKKLNQRSAPQLSPDAPTPASLSQKQTATPSSSHLVNKEVSNKAGPKPLPVVGSSISAVPVNRGNAWTKPDTGFKSAASIVLDGKSAGSSMKTPSGEFLMNQFSEPSQATSKHSSQSALHSAAKPNEKSLKKNRAVDTHIPAMNVTAERTSTGYSGSVSGISDIDLRPQKPQAQFECSLNDVSSAPAGSDSWQQVGKKRKKDGDTSHPKADPQGGASNFERLVAKLMESFPHLQRANILAVIAEVRNRHSGLKGLSMTQIVAESYEIFWDWRDKLPETPDGTSTEYMKKLRYKTEICQAWTQTGSCRNGGNCVYAHGKSDLRPLPKLAICSNFMKGTCIHGDKCVFAHGEHELRKRHSSSGLSSERPKTLVTDSQFARMSQKSQAVSFADMLKPKIVKTDNKFQDLNEDDDEDGEMCVICHDNMSPSNQKVLDCGHAYHAECINQWVYGRERTCPTCRQLALFPDEFPRLGK